MVETEIDALTANLVDNNCTGTRPAGRGKKNGHRDEEPTADGCPERIEPGEYQAICRAAEYGYAWRRTLFLRFVIVGPKYEGVGLFMACHRPSGKLRHRHKLWQQWSLVLGRNPFRGERLNKEIFKGKMYRVLVRDTDRKFETSERMPDHMQYSVVKTILEVLTGVPEVLEASERR